MISRDCWACEQRIVGQQIPRFDPSDWWRGPLTDEDYLCEVCYEKALDDYMTSRVY